MAVIVRAGEPEHMRDNTYSTSKRNINMGLSSDSRVIRLQLQTHGPESPDCWCSLSHQLHLQPSIISLISKFRLLCSHNNQGLHVIWKKPKLSWPTVKVYCNRILHIIYHVHCHETYILLVKCSHQDWNMIFLYWLSCKWPVIRWRTGRRHMEEQFYQIICLEWSHGCASHDKYFLDHLVLSGSSFACLTPLEVKN